MPSTIEDFVDDVITRKRHRLEQEEEWQSPKCTQIEEAKIQPFRKDGFQETGDGRDFEKDLITAEAELTDTRKKLRGMSRSYREEVITSINLALNAEKCTGKSCLCLVTKRRSVFFSVMLGLHFQNRGGT